MPRDAVTTGIAPQERPIRLRSDLAQPARSGPCGSGSASIHVFGPDADPSFHGGTTPVVMHPSHRSIIGAAGVSLRRAGANTEELSPSCFTHAAGRGVRFSGLAQAKHGRQSGLWLARGLLLFVT